MPPTVLLVADECSSVATVTAVVRIVVFPRRDRGSPRIRSTQNPDTLISTQLSEVNSCPRHHSATTAAPA
jgi:hypothetical protein